jgi:hypothetical protein
VTNEVYFERNVCVAALAVMARDAGYRVGTKRSDIPEWDPEWHNCVYIELPTGQVSWHYHDREADMFRGLSPYTGDWDGHDTVEKYRRLLAYLGTLA